MSGFQRVSLQSIISKPSHLVASLAACTLLFTSCETPEEVAKFCDTAVVTVNSTQPVFADMELSCLREVNTRQGFATFKPGTDSDAGCTEIGKQAEGAMAAAKVLSEYFGAIGSLASFGSAKAGSDAQADVEKASAGFGANSAAQDALGSIGRFLVSGATAGYQEKALDKDLNEVNKNVSAVTNALVTIIRDDYVGRQLKSEEQKAGSEYEEFAKNGSPEVKLLLDDRWHAQEETLQNKRASARAAVTALQTMSAGVTNLAANAHTLKAKEVSGLLGPYVSQLQAMIPQIQKAF